MMIQTGCDSTIFFILDYFIITKFQMRIYHTSEKFRNLNSKIITMNFTQLTRCSKTADSASDRLILQSTVDYDLAMQTFESGSRLKTTKKEINKLH